MSATTLSLNEQSFYGTSYYPAVDQPANFMEVPGQYVISNGGDCVPDSQPRLEIVMQPDDKFRFRYKSEREKASSHGKLRGQDINKKKSNRANYPTVKLCNWYGSLKDVTVKVSLYTDEKTPRPHILQLVGKNCNDGECSEALSPEHTVIFNSLEIESKCKQEAINKLMEKQTRLSGRRCNKDTLQKNAEKEYKLMDLNTAVLCFQAFNGENEICEKIFSTAIKNQKSAADLKICRISSFSGSCKGGDDIILLCDKIKNKDDIEIHFYDNDLDKPWKDKGVFDPKIDVHHLVAISFKTPKYKNDSGGTVYMELYRKSDQQRSVPREFIYKHDELDDLRPLKRRRSNSTSASEEPNFSQPSCSSYNSERSPSSSSAISYSDFESPSLSEDYDILKDIFSSFSIPMEISSSENELLDDILVDRDSFVSILDNRQPETNLSTSEVKMEAAEPLDLNPKQQFPEPLPIYPQSYQPPLDSISEPIVLNFSPEQKPLNRRPLFRRQVKKGGINNTPMIVDANEALVEAMGYTFSTVSSWFSNIVASFIVPSASHQKSIKKSSQDTIFAQCLPLDIDMSRLSIRDGDPDLEVTEKSSGGRSNSHRRGNDNGHQEWRKNQNVDSFRYGTSRIMEKRKEDVYLRYVSRMMSVQDEDGNLFLHLAIMEQNDNLKFIAKILKLHPEYVNTQNKFRETPLHLAVKMNAFKIVLLLLAKGGVPSIPDVKGNNCFHVASKLNFVESMKILLFPKLKCGKDSPSIDDINYDGYAPMHLAVLNNSRDCLKLLLKAGANVNTKDKRTGSTPLHLAIKHQPSLVWDLFYDPGIDILMANFSGHSIMDVLCELKGIAKSEINKSKDLEKWVEKVLSLPYNDVDNVSSSDSSSNNDSSDDDCNEDVSTSSHGCEIFAKPMLSRGLNDNSLTEECELKLIKYLDVSSGWRKLGLFLELDEKTLDNLATLSKNSSPSKPILQKVKNLYQVDEKQALINILNVAGLEDAANML